MIQNDFRRLDTGRPRTLNDVEILKHLKGTHFIGTYPLLKDNTSWFIAADFNKENWDEECHSLISACNDLDIPAYLERSLSGNGGHVWLFFEKPYPAEKSRRIMIHILQQTGLFLHLTKAPAMTVSSRTRTISTLTGEVLK